MFIWRSNLLGSSGKGHEYMLKHLLGTKHGLQGKDLGDSDAGKPEEVIWREQEQTGKLDLLVTLDFRMSTTCLYSDIVLPTATWYRKRRYEYIGHASVYSSIVDRSRPGMGSTQRLGIFYKGIAERFSEVCVGHLGAEKDVVTVPTLHDTPGELAQPLTVKDWKKGECEPIPGKTMPNLVVVERDYPNTYKKFSALGPLMSKPGQWRQRHQLEYRNRSRTARPSQSHRHRTRHQSQHAAHRQCY